MEEKNKNKKVLKIESQGPNEAACSPTFKQLKTDSRIRTCSLATSGRQFGRTGMPVTDKTTANTYINFVLKK